VKEKLLDKVKQECIDDVGKSYPGEGKVVVFGEGDPDAGIVLIGEAPGEKETKLVKPFVGQAGKNLDEFLEVLELKREYIYITNTVKFRPFKVNPKTGRLSNRPPNKNEIKLCLPYLLRQLEIISPKIVVTLGNTPLQAVTGDNGTLIGENHGRPLKMDKFYLFPLYHPASIIYNAGLKDTYHEDLLKLKEFMKSVI
jgi:uracil-DNA glycosylase, family 4